MNDKDVTIVIKANPAQFAAAMKAVQSGMKSAATAVRQGGTTVTNFASDASNAFGNIADGIWNVVKTASLLGTTGAFGIVAMAKASWDQVSAVQQATVALRAYEKDGALVNKTLSELVSYARSDMGVLFQRQDLFAAAQGLKMMGAETGNLTRYVEVMSRSVGLGLSNWDDLTRIIGRVGSTGRLTGNDFEYLQSAGFKLDNSLRNTNVTYDKLFAALDKGIPAEAMAGQANTIRGTIVRLQSAFRDLGADILGVDKDTSTFANGGLGSVLTSSLSELITFLKTPEMKQGFANMGKSMAEFSKSAVPVIQNVLLWIINNGKTIVAAVQGLVAAFIAAKIAIVALNIATMVLEGTFKTNAIVVGIIALIAVIVFLQARFNIFGKAVDGIVIAFEWLKRVFGEVKDSIASFSSATIERFGQIVDGVASAFNTAKDAVMSFVRDALGWMGDVLNNVTGWIEDHQVGLRNWAIVIGTLLLPKMVQLGVEAAKAAISTLVSWAKTFVQMTASAATTTLSMIIESAKASAAWVKNAAVSSYAWVTKELPKIVASMARTAVQSAIQAARAALSWTIAAGQTALAWGTTFALYMTNLARMVAQTALAAIRMAASWLLAMGPIGLIIAVVVGLAALIISNWDTVKQWLASFWNWLKDNWLTLLKWLGGPLGFLVATIIQNWDTIKNAFAAAWQFIQGVWNGVVDFFRGVWDGIKNIFGEVIGFYAWTFQTAWNGVKAVFSGVGSFFRSVWDTIVGVFGRIGMSIGDAISGAVRGAVNGVLGFAENTINGFIKSINGAIAAINRIPGVNIGKLGLLSIPRMATGGIAHATPGGQQITVAEGGQDEWVVPESKMASLVRQVAARGNTQQSAPTQQITQEFNIHITVQNDGTEFTMAQAESMAQKISQALRRQGLGINEMGALR